MEFIDRYHFWAPQVNRVTLDEGQRAWLIDFLCFTLPALFARTKVGATYRWKRLRVLAHLTPVYVMYSMFCCDTGRFYRACRYGWRGWRWPGLNAWKETRQEDLHYASDGPTYYWLISKNDHLEWRISEGANTYDPGLIARILHRMGVRPNASSGICGGITYGYGELDDNGYWRYMLRIEY